MTPPQTHSRNHSTSPTLSDSKNTLLLSIDTSPSELPKMFGTCPKLANDEGEDNSNHRAKRHHESPPAGSDEEKGTSKPADENFAYHAGSKFFFVHGPWIRSGDDVFDTNIDNRYNAVESFENDENMCQKWLRRQFMNGLDTQRNNTATWIRSNCSSIFGISESDLLKSDIRNSKFREEIGWVRETGLYSSIDVPILHKDWHGKYSLSSIFLNPKLMGIYVALIHGPIAGKIFMNGRSLQPQTGTMAQIYNIRNITPGAIAACGVLARWALSADDTLQEVGSSTGIQYFSDFEEYLTILETGLQQKKTSIVNIIKEWDEKIFFIETSRLTKAMDLLLTDSEGEDDEVEDQDGNWKASRSIANFHPVVM